MFNQVDKYATAPVECGSSLGLRPQVPTVRERLQAQKAEIEKYLAEVNDALEALDKFPEFEKVHNLLAKVRL